jgi:methionine synthase II (cobalamin-independent)
MYEISSNEIIKEVGRRAIEWAVAKQLELDIRPICSGKYNRHIFYGGFFEKVEGITPIPDLPIIDAFRTDFPTTTKLAEMGAKTRAAVVCTGTIRCEKSAYMDEWKLLRSTLLQSQ